MVKLLGGLLVFLGGGMAWFFQRLERRRQRDMLSELLYALRRMGEEIRMTRTPLPRLLESLAAECGPEVSALFQAAAVSALRGENLMETWRAGVTALPLPSRMQAALYGLNFHGDEETICKEISLAIHRLTEGEEELERRRPEEDKRTAALCFSAAALLVILLI